VLLAHISYFFSQNFHIIQLLKTTHPIKFLDRLSKIAQAEHKYLVHDKIKNGPNRFNYQFLLTNWKQWSDSDYFFKFIFPLPSDRDYLKDTNEA
jgi:hypothetical protein